MDAEHKVYIAGSMSNFSLLTNEFDPIHNLFLTLKPNKKIIKNLQILADSGVDLLILELLVDIDHSKNTSGDNGNRSSGMGRLKLLQE